MMDETKGRNWIKLLDKKMDKMQQGRNKRWDETLDKGWMKWSKEVKRWMKRTKEPKKVPRNRGDSETSSLAHRSYHLPTYFLEGVCFVRLGLVSFVRLWRWVLLQLCVVLSVQFYWNLALSLHDTTSRWLHRNFIPHIGCHYFRSEVIALPRNTLLIYFCLICLVFRFGTLLYLYPSST
jgi:hypothetical protein